MEFRGNQGANADLAASHGQAMRAFAQGLGLDAAQAEDSVQESLLRLLLEVDRVDAQIVFSQPFVADGAVGNEGIFSIDGEGAAPRPVDLPTGPGGRAIRPSWTPDGGAIIFAIEATTGADPSIGIVNADGTGLVNVPEGETRRTHPRLRPVS